MGTLRAKMTHFGLHAVDMTRMQDFYTNVLGLIVNDTGHSPRLNMDLVFMSASPANHHQVVLVSGRPDTSGFNPINQISFTVENLAELREVHDRALANGATGMRTTSHGNAWSIYFKDPEGNTIEVYLDTPWYVPQPHGDPLDLSKSDEQIWRETEAVCRADPGFMPVEAYQAKVAARLAG